MAEKRDILCVQICRGMAPAVAIAATVAACASRKIGYKLITGRPAPEAKQEAAQMAYDAGKDLILCEDDFLAESEIWEQAIAGGEEVLVASAIMRNGELNVWYHGPRLVYSGTVFVVIPWTALDRIGSPWFQGRNLSFEHGAWMDMGPNDKGHHSDTWFYHRCWVEDVPTRVMGFVTHLMTPANKSLTKLNTPDEIKPLGMMSCKKVVS